MKKILLVSTLIILLTSCVVSPPPAPPIYSKNTGDIKLQCPWECGTPYRLDNYYINDKLCQNIDEFISELDATYDDSVYIDLGGTDEYNDVAFHGLHNYDNLKLTTGIGWTGWWVGLAKHCVNEGYWNEGNENSISYGDETNLIIKTKGKENFGSLLKGKEDYNYISIEGTKTSNGGKTLTSPSFNSPFIYFENMDDGDISVSVHSEFNNYKTVPEFSSVNTWNGKLSDDNITVNGVTESKLFYELDLKKIDLTRNGRNFSSKELLISYLEDDDFFERMGFTEEQKENSLGYILPKIKESNNYYLTILGDSAIEKISQLKFSKNPDEFIRKFFAIYSTNTAVKTNGDIDFPKLEDYGDKSLVIETGEVLIDSSTIVIWEK